MHMMPRCTLWNQAVATLRFVWQLPISTPLVTRPFSVHHYALKIMEAYTRGPSVVCVICRAGRRPMLMLPACRFPLRWRPRSMLCISAATAVHMA